MKPIYVDYLTPLFRQKIKTACGKNQIFPRALGVSYNPTRVIDACAGLGYDAVLMAAMGFQVIAIEKSAEVYALLQEGWERAQKEDEFMAQLKGQLTLVYGDSLELIKNLEAEVVYLDPMFPEKKKSALPKKEMQILQKLLRTEEQGLELLQLAKEVASQRVVVKRGKNSAPIDERVSHQFLGKTIRYDMYLC